MSEKNKDNKDNKDKDKKLKKQEKVQEQKKAELDKKKVELAKKKAKEDKKLAKEQAKKDKKVKKNKKDNNNKNNKNLADKDKNHTNKKATEYFNALDDDDIDDDNPKSKNSKKDTSKIKDKNSLIIAVILGLIASVSLINVFSNNISYKNSNGFLKINEILSTAGGSEKNYIKIGVGVGGLNKDLNKLDEGMIEIAITNALQDANFNFEELLKEEGYEYLKEFLLNELQKEFGDKIESISIHSLFTQSIR